MSEPKKEDFKYSYVQLNPITWAVNVETKDGIKLTQTIRANGVPNDDFVFHRLLADPNQRKNFIIEADIISIEQKKEIKEEIKFECPAPEIIENKVEEIKVIENIPDAKIVEENLDKKEEIVDNSKT